LSNQLFHYRSFKRLTSIEKFEVESIHTILPKYKRRKIFFGKGTA